MMFIDDIDTSADAAPSVAEIETSVDTAPSVWGMLYNLSIFCLAVSLDLR